MQSRRLDGIPRGMARFTEMAMSAISKGRSVGRQRENPITAYIRGTGGWLKLGETRPPRGSVLTRAAGEKPTLWINQSNRSIRRACDRFDSHPPTLSVMVSLPCRWTLANFSILEVFQFTTFRFSDIEFGLIRKYSISKRSVSAGANWCTGCLLDVIRDPTDYLHR